MEGRPTELLLEQLRRDIDALKRDLYGNPQVRQKGVFDRLESLEKHYQELHSAYQRERLQQGTLARLEGELDEVKLNYRVMRIYLGGIMGGVGTLVVMALAATVVGLLRYLVGG